jgi:hypothetical protein
MANIIYYIKQVRYVDLPFYVNIEEDPHYTAFSAGVYQQTF